MKLSLVKSLGCLPVSNRELNRQEIQTMMFKGIESGYLIDPKSNYNLTMRYLNEMKFNPNATFYKEWQQIREASEVELLFNQLLHYCTTYGTGHSMGNGFTENPNPVEVYCSKLKFIPAVSYQEIYEKVKTMLSSGIALSDDLLADVIDFLTHDYIQWMDHDDLLDQIANKEAQVRICITLHRYPNDEFGLLRCLVYMATNSTMLIKSKDVIWKVRQYYKTNLPKFTDLQMTKLSRIFLRFKPLFLAMRGTPHNKEVVNKIRRLAVKNHTPLKIGFWEDVFHKLETSSSATLKTAEEKVNELNNFKKVQLMMSIAERAQAVGKSGKMFIIRNGRQFVRTDYKNGGDVPNLLKLYAVLERSLIESLKSKACRVRLPEALQLTVPTSEKNFIGNYPLGTAVKLTDSNNVIGIYWRNKWGCHDFDLRYMSGDGSRRGDIDIGWCTDHRYDDGSTTILYSGDMTNADPEAAECLWFNSKVPNGVIKVNRYYGEKGCKFRLFVAVEDKSKDYQNLGYRREDGYKGVMVKPDSIVFQADIENIQDGEKQVAAIIDGYLVMSNLNTGDRMVADPKYKDIITEQMKRKSNSFIDLKSVLNLAGFQFIEDPNEEVDIDFTVATKDQFIGLFS